MFALFLKENGIIIGIVIMFILWLVLFKRIARFFEKCISMYSSHKFKLPELNVLFHSLTSGVFCFISVPICFSTFKPSTSSDSSLMYWLLDSFRHMMDRCATTESVDPSRNFKFIILYSCLLHSVYTSFANNLEERPLLSTLKKGAVLSFFASTYCFGCTEAGFVFLGLSNLSLGTLEAARLLKVCHNKTNSMLIKILSFGQFVVHCVIWISIYLFLVPFVVLSSVEVLTMNNDNRLPLSIMLFSLLIFYFIELRDSPLNMSTTSGNGIFRLFETPKSSLMAANNSTKRNQNKQKSKENLLVLYQTTKCAMAVKKKVQKIRQDKLGTRLLSASEIKPEPIEVIEIFDD
ncbi:uncharacterized protein LOC132942991 [Metopolophium dirhodum]|uniref:uncharacterized protein LOC132942991 n=1 Tax=Metopolophium dirhodum TaxID=44670 RepID=UPI00298FB4A9|nr:uncharacterized protein LOC132942991 [Metopolophium dirhodum]